MPIQVNDLVIGTITYVKPYALFMEFEDGSKGLLNISELSDEYIKDIEKFGTTGDKIKVKVLSIDKNNGFLRVSLKQVPLQEKYTTHFNNSRKAPLLNGDEFKPLKDKLDSWIDETYLKMKDR